LKTHRSVSQFHNDWIANLLLVGDQPLLTQRDDSGGDVGDGVAA
jgi:hypothetical protein